MEVECPRDKAGIAHRVILREVVANVSTIVAWLSQEHQVLERTEEVEVPLFKAMECAPERAMNGRSLGGHT